MRSTLVSTGTPGAAGSTTDSCPSGRVSWLANRVNCAASSFATAAARPGSASVTRMISNRVVVSAVGRTASASWSGANGSPSAEIAGPRIAWLVTSSAYVPANCPEARKVDRSVLTGPTSNRTRAS